MGYRTKKLDHLGIVAGICERIQLVEQIDSFFPEKDRKVSVGLAVKAMILNALGFSSRPLYLSSEFFENKPVETLLGQGLEASDLNDDSLGRALDALFLALQGEVAALNSVVSHPSNSIPRFVSDLVQNFRKQNLEKEAVPALIQVIQRNQDIDLWGTEKREIWTTAAWALGEMGEHAKEAILVLMQALQHNQNLEMRWTAAYALGKMGEHAKMGSLLSYKDPILESLS